MPASVSQSTFRFFMQGFDAAPSPYLDGAAASRSIERVLQNGNGAGQIQTVSALDYTLAASGTTNIDLRTGNDVYGVALVLDEVVAFFVENAADGAGGVIELQPGASNAFTNLLGAGSAIKLPRGTAIAMFLTDFDGVDKWLVTATNKTLQIVETGGVNSAHVVVQLWGRR